MSGYDWDWLNGSKSQEADTIKAGSRLVVYGSVPQPILVRGVTVWVYDIELAIMLAKSWAEQGMSRSEIEQLFLERIPQ